MKKLLLLHIIFFIGCNSNTKDPIIEYQQSLINDGKTGSNVFKVYKDGEIVYDKVLNSGAVGDRNIDENTIFAIHSMTKTVTTVAAMILHEKGMFELDDPLHKYLPEFKEVKCKGSEGIYDCENEIKVVDILTHRSGYIYYLDNGDNWLTGTHNSLYPSYINTSRFNNLDDFKSYPADISKDIDMLNSISENIILFNPDVDEIYSEKVVSDFYDFGDLDQYMEGKHRKGHFQGVATVVNKLFEIVNADNVYFGEKDFQQLRIIEDLVQKMGYKLNVIRCKTIRQKDGLALSSRNKKLDISSQNIATNLFKALSFAKKNFETLDLEKIYTKVEDLLENFPKISVEYFAIANEKDLKPIKKKKKNQKYRAFIAADISGVRLIDNIKLY